MDTLGGQLPQCGVTSFLAFPSALISQGKQKAERRSISL